MYYCIIATYASKINVTFFIKAVDTITIYFAVALSVFTCMHEKYCNYEDI